MPTSIELARFLLLYARNYLAAGGPTSRLEERVIQTGNLYNFETEVFATPTGVFLTLKQKGQTPYTELSRIKGTQTNLNQICILERVLDTLIAKKISLHAAKETLQSKFFDRNPYPRGSSAIAAFVTGATISFNYYQQALIALIGGAITVISWRLIQIFATRGIATGVFSDFLVALFALAMAAFVHLLYPAAVEAYSLGSIVLFVPGLLLTNAIAELADMNLVSGTAKMMQAFLSLLALGLAFYLFTETSLALGLAQRLEPVIQREHSTFFSAITVMLSSCSFGVMIRVPPKSLPLAVLTGFAGWFALQFASQLPIASAAPFIGSFVAGICALAISRTTRLPSQVYSVPGILSMLPGLVALMSFRDFTNGSSSSAASTSAQAVITAASIVFGLVAARIPYQVMDRIKRIKLWS